MVEGPYDITYGRGLPKSWEIFREGSSSFRGLDPLFLFWHDVWMGEVPLCWRFSKMSCQTIKMRGYQIIVLGARVVFIEIFLLEGTSRLEGQSLLGAYGRPLPIGDPVLRGEGLGMGEK